MLRFKRIERLAQILNSNGLDAIFAGPSTDLEYLADLRLFDDARTKGLLFSKTGKVFALTPMLYGEEMRAALGNDAVIKIWADHEGFKKAFTAGANEIGVTGGIIAINDGVRAVDLIEMKTALDAEYVNGAHALAPLRRVKAQDELENMRRAGSIADAVMEDISKFISAGQTEREIQETLIKLFEKHGCETLSFSPIVASGPNGSMPHYHGNARTLRDGDFVVIDMGCRFNGYCSDITRTFCIGEPTNEMKRAYAIVLESQKAGEAAVQKGASGQDVDRAGRRIIDEAGYGDYFLNRLGHGIGIAIHESPYIIEGNVMPLEPGNVFSIEPGIYIAGKFGVRIENIVAVKPDGTAEPLNKFTREMIVIR